MGLGFRVVRIGFKGFGCGGQVEGLRSKHPGSGLGDLLKNEPRS